jgi:hypothetical protein
LGFSELSDDIAAFSADSLRSEQLKDEIVDEDNDSGNESMEEFTPEVFDGNGHPVAINSVSKGLMPGDPWFCYRGNVYKYVRDATFVIPSFCKGKLVACQKFVWWWCPLENTTAVTKVPSGLKLEFDEEFLFSDNFPNEHVFYVRG